MILLRRLTILALITFAAPGFAQISQQRLPPLSRASAGEVATGEIITEDGNQLQLNIRPCATDRVVVIFHKPYVKEFAGKTQCNGMAKTLMQVIQQ